MKLQINQGGTFTIYDSFHLKDLHLKSMNPSKMQYISYLKSQKYLRYKIYKVGGGSLIFFPMVKNLFFIFSPKDADNFFEENTFQQINRELKTADDPNGFQIFPISLSRFNQSLGKTKTFPSGYVNEGSVSYTPLVLRLEFEQTSDQIQDFFLINTFYQSFKINYATSPVNQVPTIEAHSVFT